MSLRTGTYTVQLAAGIEQPLMVPARHLLVQVAAASFDIKLLKANNKVGEALGVGQGFSAGPYAEEFQGLRLLSTTAQSVTLVLGSAKVSLGTVAGTVAVSSPSTATALADVDLPAAQPAAQLVADASNRRQIHVYNGGPSIVRWGDATVDATHGAPIPPGVVAALDYAGALYLFNTDAANPAPISMTELS